MLIFRIIKTIDPNAFVSQSSVQGVFGEGFDPIKVKVGKKEASLHTYGISPQKNEKGNDKEKTKDKEIK